VTTQATVTSRSARVVIADLRARYPQRQVTSMWNVCDQLIH